MKYRSGCCCCCCVIVLVLLLVVFDKPRGRQRYKHVEYTPESGFCSLVGMVEPFICICKSFILND